MRLSLLASFTGLAALSLASVIYPGANSLSQYSAPETLESDSPFDSSATTDSDQDPFGPHKETKQANPFGNDAVQPNSQRKPAPATTANSGDSSPARNDDRRSPDTVARMRIEAVLDKTVNLDFQGHEFSQVMDMLRSDFGINILLDQSAADDSLSRDEVITFSADKITLRQSLLLMLQSKNATICIKGGVLLIVSQDVAEDGPYLERSIFNVRNLLGLIQKLEGQKMETAQSGGIQIFLGSQYGGIGGGGGGGFGAGPKGANLGGGGVFSTPPQGLPQGPVENPNQEVIDQIGKGGSKELVLKGNFVVNPVTNSPEMRLIHLIQATISPDSWSDTNGDGTIDIVGGMLVLTQTHENLFQTKEFLNELEYFLKKKD